MEATQPGIHKSLEAMQALCHNYFQNTVSVKIHAIHTCNIQTQQKSTINT